MLFVLKKSLKSLQNRLHEFLWELDEEIGVAGLSSGAVTHARRKLKASAFVELNRICIVEKFYGPQYAPLVELWGGHRLLGIDSSKLRLPKSEELKKRFGVVKVGNERGVCEEYPEGRVSVLYDLLNGLGLEGCLVSSSCGEVDLAIGHLGQARKGDVIITDRGYCGYEWFAEVRRHGLDFICRCQNKSFGIVNELFARNEEGVSVVVELRAQKNLVSQLRRKGLAEVMKVRFVTVRLSSGELEVLATSLLQEQEYGTEEFSGVYWARWGHETYYGDLKGALDLEHFSGKTIESVEQDFQALVFLANLQSVLVGPAEEELAQRSRRLKNPVQVNRSVALHAVKTRALDLLASRVPIPKVLEQLHCWFLHNPVALRQSRKVPRSKPSLARSYHYQRRVRKCVY